MTLSWERFHNGPRVEANVNKNDLIYKGLEYQYQTFAVKEIMRHIVTESYVHRFKISDSSLW